MRRFVLKENIKHFSQLLKTEQGPFKQDLFSKMLADARHEFSWLESIWLWTCPTLSISTARPAISTVIRFLSSLAARRNRSSVGRCMV